MAEVPLATRMRPRSFGEFVGQTHLVGPGTALSELIEGGHLPSVVLWGPAGSGKTTLAHLLADAVGAEVVQLSAVSSGVADARKVMERAKGGMLRTVLFVDEVHRWSKAQQDVLLPAVEGGDDHPDRRDHREPVLLAGHAAPIALPPAPPGAAVAVRGSGAPASRAGGRGPRPRRHPGQGRGRCTRPPGGGGRR